jgi:hypothetical protein
MNADKSMKTLTENLTDEAALEALLVISHLDSPTEDEQAVQAMLCDELENRFPEVDELMLAYIESPEKTASYADTLIASILAVKEMER